MQDRLDRRAVLRQEPEQAFVDAVQVCRRELASSHVGLVGHDHDAHPHLFAQSDERVRGSWDQLDLVGVSDVVALDVDRSIAIDEGEPAGHEEGAQTSRPRLARTPSLEKANEANCPPDRSRAVRIVSCAEGGAARRR